MNASSVMENQSDLKDVSQLAEYLRLSKQTIYSFVHYGKIGYIKRGKMLLFSKQHVEQFIATTTKEVAVSNQTNEEAQHG